MFDIVGKKFWYFVFSGLLILPGIFSLFYWGLNLGIDFTGGTVVEIRLEKATNREEIIQVGKEAGVEISTVQTTGENSYQLRTNPLEDDSYGSLKSALDSKFGKVTELRRETVGPTVGAELLRRSVIALVVSSLMIVIYIAFAFRSVPPPTNSWRFGIVTIATLIHDVLILLGIFSILGHFLGVQVDALFVTALLTTIGFSVHDTIVVFDRIRENLTKKNFSTFAETANHSIMQTIGRSLNTSLTVIFVLVALLLFGGSSMYWFIMALLIGMIAGTYSSIFNAAPLLVFWQELADKRLRRKK